MKKLDFTILIPLLIAAFFIITAVITSDANNRYFCIIMFTLIMQNLQSNMKHFELKTKIEILKEQNKIYQSSLDALKFIDDKQFNQLVLFIKQKLNDKK
ncbi:hypothetical protein ACTS9E_15260 [Empedobacter brevis]